MELDITCRGNEDACEGDVNESSPEAKSKYPNNSIDLQIQDAQ